MTNSNSSGGLGVEQLLRALLLLAIAEREEGDAPATDRRRTEVLLAEAGFSLQEIASLTGKPYETVKSRIRRARDKE